MIPWGKASEYCSPCWCAGRRGAEGVPKPNALRRKPILVGGLGHRISSTPHEVRPHLVGHDKQDVGLHFGADSRIAPCSKYGEANNEQRVQTSHLCKLSRMLSCDSTSHAFLIMHGPGPAGARGRPKNLQENLTPL